jgi:PadR family transcriptional regulator, regulatory protein PadR
MYGIVPTASDPEMAQMRRGAIEYCVLALLRNGDRYGFDLVREMSGADGLVTSEGTIYPLLARLRREGKVETYEVESASGPPRRYHRLTAVGAVALSDFVVNWKRFSAAVTAILDGEKTT